MFDDEKLILVSLQESVQSKNVEADIKGFVNFINSIKGSYSELDNLLEEKIRRPTLDLSTYARGKLVINTLVKLLSKE